MQGATLPRQMDRVQLIKIDLQISDLASINFSDPVFQDCKLAGADLEGANFSLCNLQYAVLSVANLDRVDFKGPLVSAFRISNSQMKSKLIWTGTLSFISSNCLVLNAVTAPEDRKPSLKFTAGVVDRHC